MTAPYSIGVLGGGTVGHHLAMELGRLGMRVLMFDERPQRLASFLEAGKPVGEVAVASSLRELVEHLEPPRRILLSLADDEPASELLDALTAMIEPSDVVADLSYSYFKKTERREALMARPGARYLDVGACAAPREKDRRRYVFHVGGHRVAYESIRSTLEKLAPAPDGPAVAYLGPAGAGHLIANVAESLELAFRQGATEVARLVRCCDGLTAAQAADQLREMSKGRSPFLAEAATSLVTPGGDQGQVASADRQRMPEVIRRVARTALDFSVFVPTLSTGIRIGRVVPGCEVRSTAAVPPPLPLPAPAGWTPDDALAAFELASASIVTQGFALIGVVADQLDYGTKLPDVARVWSGLAGFDRATLDVVTAGFQKDPAALAPAENPLCAHLANRLPALRRAVARCALAGIPIPVLSSALTFLDEMV
jgi:6-phosphogluconate dehydrogenase